MSPLAFLSLLYSLIFFIIGNYLYFLIRKVPVFKPLNKILLAICILCAGWAFSQFAFRQAKAIEVAFFWMKINWAIRPMLIVFFLHLVFILTEREAKNLVLMILYCSAICFSLVQFLILPIKPFPTSLGWTYVFDGGNFFSYLSGLYSIIINIIALTLCVMYIYEGPAPRKRLQTKYLVFGVIFSSAIVYFTEWVLPSFQIMMPEVATTGFIITCFVFGFSSIKYDLFILGPESAVENIVSLMPDSLFLIDATGTILYVNHTLTAMLGYKQKEIIGQSADVIFMGPQAKKLPFAHTKLGRLLKSDVVNDIETYFKPLKGKSIPVSLSLSAMRHKSGELMGVVCMGRDITVRKGMEEELRAHYDHLGTLVEERTTALQALNEKLVQEIHERKQIEEEVRWLNEALEQKVKERTKELETANQELKELDRLKDGFLTLVSHELRTPLTSIRSFSEILITYDDIDPERKAEFLEIINSESKRLARLINDILDLSKIKSGKMVWNDKLVSVGDVIKEVARTQQALLEEKELQLMLNIPTALPLFNGDEDKLFQVITNLLGNAIKFSNNGGVIIIHAQAFDGQRSREPSKWIKVAVSDNGVGISEQNLKIIFSQFRQAETDTLHKRAQGTGLGLPICKEIINHYGGNIWAESILGQGSTFYIALPATPVSQHDIRHDRRNRLIQTA